jgi:glutamate-1-semialdehyde aminotransferase
MRQLAVDRRSVTPRERQHLDALIARYTARTRSSKRRAAEARFVRASHKNSMGFNLLWKELNYPIAASRGRGSRVWDVDGNEYVDLQMGFSVFLFGHSPTFVVEAVERELRDGQGLILGVDSTTSDQVARLVSDLTGAERVAFFNSGTEAVMVALRLARAATERRKLALFSGSFHGTFDGTLADKDPRSASAGALPISPGTPQSFVEDTLVLDYCTPEALETLRRHGEAVAGILVEPVQTRAPQREPREFLHELRDVANEIGAVLIFDEMVTGFRLHPAGAQGWFGVEADLSTYGKVAGGGLPLGIVAGKAHVMDGIDGGAWTYGDDSLPPHDARRAYVGGTFCENPLSMAAALAALRHLEAEGPALQADLNARTTELVRRLDAILRAEDAPITVAQQGSIFKLGLPGRTELLIYHLLEKGVYVWGNRPCFLSTAHTDDDVERVATAMHESLVELRAGGFLEPVDTPA